VTFDGGCGGHHGADQVSGVHRVPGGAAKFSVSGGGAALRRLQIPGSCRHIDILNSRPIRILRPGKILFEPPVSAACFNYPLGAVNLPWIALSDPRDVPWPRGRSAANPQTRICARKKKTYDYPSDGMSPRGYHLSVPCIPACACGGVVVGLGLQIRNSDPPLTEATMPGFVPRHERGQVSRHRFPRPVVARPGLVGADSPVGYRLLPSLILRRRTAFLEIDRWSRRVRHARHGHLARWPVGRAVIRLRPKSRGQHLRLLA